MKPTLSPRPLRFLAMALTGFVLTGALPNPVTGSVEAPAPGLSASFDREGIVLEAGPQATAKAPMWSWSWRTDAWGRPGAMEPAVEAEAERTMDRVSYARGALVEWYEARGGNFEQGYTVRCSPAGAGPLVIEGEIHSRGLRAVPSMEGIDFVDARGIARVRYDHLLVLDRENRTLASRLDSEEDGERTILRITIEDAVAAYPLLVDPIISSPTWQHDGNDTSARYGSDVATAGDVNGDGYSDLLVGAITYTGSLSQQGAAYLYLGSAQGLSNSSSWSKAGQAANDHYGVVAPAGDVNGDGYDDVIVGASSYDGQGTNEGRAYLYLGSATGLSTTAAWTANGTSDNAYFGGAVGTAGDVDGDGYADVLVGSPGWGGGLNPNRGRAYLYLGGPSGLSVSPDWIYSGAQSGTYVGYSVATAGDVDADTFSDVIIGTDTHACYCFHGDRTNGLEAAPRWSGSGLETGCTAGDVDGDGYADVIAGDFLYNNLSGRAFLYRGGPNGLSNFISWSYEGTQASERVGVAVATAGDVNGDGYADVIVGANTYSNGQSSEGRAMVFQGSASGLSPVPIWAGEGNQTDANFGASVGTAGDVSGDGLSDICVGVPEYDAGQTDEGRAYVYYGTTAVLDTATNVIKDGDQVGAGLGISVRSAGDVNGDGHSDLYIGAWHYDNGQSNEGFVFVYHGYAGGLPAQANWRAESDQENAGLGCAGGGIGDVNGDGYSDLAVGAYGYNGAGGNVNGMVRVYHGSPAGLEAAPAWEQYGEGDNSLYGWSVAGAGDVDGDGYADLLVGQPQWDSAGLQDRGRALLYLGSANGLSTTPVWTFEGQNAGARLGLSVACAGDVNADGVSDIIVGAPDYTNGQTNEGGAFLFLGSTSGPSMTPSWSGEGNQALGAYGFSVSGAGDVDGDGYSDVVVADPAYDEGQADEGKIFVYMGSASGLAAGPAQTFQSNQAGAAMGYTVAGAGDLNGDGYGDLAVGLANGDFPEVNEGAAWLYTGGPGGLTGAWSFDSDQDYAHMGQGLGPAGDLNADGFADLAVGAPDYNGGFDTEGRVSLFFGNAGDGLDRIPQQLRIDAATPIDLLGRSDAVDGFMLAMRGRTPAGRGRVRMVWEVKPLGVPFDGTGLGMGAIRRTATPVAGAGSYVSLVESVNGLSIDAPYCWRVRLASHSPFFPGSAWLAHSGNGRTETDLRTGLAPSAVTEQIGAGHGRRSLRAGPNPFTDHLHVQFALPQTGSARLSVYDVAGREVAKLADGLRDAGNGATQWDGRRSDGRRAPAGAYYVRLQMAGTEEVEVIEVRLAR